jgi:hypothetical protein
LEYLHALFTNAKEELEFIEECARADGYGPLMACSTISNISAIKVNCRMYMSLR